MVIIGIIGIIMILFFAENRANIEDEHKFSGDWLDSIASYKFTSKIKFIN